MIKRVQVKNYRCLKEVDVNLNDITVFVGRNGSGKSTFLDVLRFVRDGLRLGLENAVIERRGFSSIRRWSRSRPNQVEITITVEQGSIWGRYSFTLGSDGDSYRVKSERGEVGKERGVVDDFFERQVEKWIHLPDGFKADNVQGAPALEPTALALPFLGATTNFYQLRSMLQGQFYTIFPNTLRDPQKATTENVLQEDGKNFVSILRKISKDARYFPELKAALSQVVEGVTDIRVIPAAGFLVAELQHEDIVSSFQDPVKAPWFDLSQESDGTLRMLGMLVALYQRAVRPGFPSASSNVLALEEPEIALHPGAVAVLCDVMKEAARRRRMQIILTTQSPDLISSFEIEDLRVVERVKGISEIGPVDTVQCEVVKERLFTAGDIVRTEGLKIDRRNSQGLMTIAGK